MKTKVMKIEDILNRNASENEAQNQTDQTSKRNAKVKHKTTEEMPRGKSKSGRVWKSTKTRFSSTIKTKGIRNSFEKKQALRNELKRVKEVSRELLAARKEKKELKKQRRRENLQRQEENRKKSEIVQVIKNPSKIKRMKKKQLRHIEKRDVDNKT